MYSLQLTPLADGSISNGGYADLNFGSETAFTIGRATSGPVTVLSRGLLRFNLSGIESGSTILRATLQLTKSGAGSGSGTGLFLCHPLTRGNWVEGEFTWNRYTAASVWTSPGGDFNSELSDSFSGTVDDDMQFEEIGPMVTWAIGQAMTTLDLILIGPEAAGASFFKRPYTREHATALERPLLLVDYSPPIARPSLVQLADAARYAASASDAARFSVAVGDTAA